MAIEREQHCSRGVQLIGASAGTGKTHFLTGHVAEELESSSVDAESLVAVTFTTKAQAELEARLRRRLLEQGAHAPASALPLAYMGTTHSVCLRLLKEFALEAGLSPSLDVIPGNEGRRLLQSTLERELPRALRERLDALSTSLQVRWDPRVKCYDFITPIDDIMSLARSNRIAPEALPAMAERSWEQLRRLLPPPVEDGSALEAELLSALQQAHKDIAGLGCTQDNTQNACKLLCAAARELASGRLPWSQWAKLAKVKPGKRGVPFVTRVHTAAAAYETHPRFQADIRGFIECTFEAARVALRTYADWKAKRGLVDYVDMIDGALTLLENDDITRELARRLRLVVVDEFQDTSPIQLALFMRLQTLVGASVWVGDRKQCIFEYAGADPDLMEAVTHWASERGGSVRRLSCNYRSRPELVEICSHVFTSAFARHGLSAQDVAASAHRSTLAECSGLPPLGVWWLEGQEQAALAAGVAAMLGNASATPIVDAHTGRARSLRASDIALLVYTNAEAERLSQALAAHGINSALPRTGLMATPEGSLLRAALRWLVDRKDELAAAEIAALTGFEGRTHDEWLAERLRQVAQVSDLKAVGMSPAEIAELHAPRGADPRLRLDAVRPALAVLSPTEVVDRVLAVFDFSALAERWPDAPQRASNLEALRTLAADYEERCSYQHEAASLGGLLRYFEDTREKIRQRDEERATDEQHVGGADAIVISTYHKAKGLEWPVVILSSLGRSAKRDAFDVAVESDGGTFDPLNPLAGRWIRYWPWPLGLVREAGLATRAVASDAGLRVAEREARERVRLLYVGWTRARDQLVLGIRRQGKGGAVDWLNELCDEQGPIVTLPSVGVDELQVRMGPNENYEVACRCAEFRAPEEFVASQQELASRLWFTPANGAPPRVDYRLTPSRAAEEAEALGAAHVVRTHRLKRRMAFTTPRGITWDAIGTALHAFLAADIEGLGDTERRSLAERILSRAGLASAFANESLLEAADSLRDFTASRWPNAFWHREIPIRARLDSERGTRLIDGCIDLLLETPQGVVLIDHKSFPGRTTEWETRALGYAPQLLAYARALELAGKNVLGMYVHFTVGGGMVEVERSNVATAVASSSSLG